MGVTVVVSGGSVTVTTSAASASVSNSDDTYTATVAAGGSLEIPDITITKNDDTTVTYPAAKDMDLGDIDPPSAVPSTWAEMVAEYGIGYNYPEPKRTTSYRTGDEHSIETTYFGAAVRAANGLKPRQSLASYSVLNNNNVEGNTTRFLDELGGTDFSSGLIIDHYTGLMWYNPGLGAMTNWLNVIDACLASTQGGYSDWFLPSIGQMFSIFDGDSNPQYTQAPFNALENFWYFTSTSMTNNTDTFMACYANVNADITIDLTKTLAHPSNQYFQCRKHY